MSTAEFKEFIKLKTELFGNDKFVEPDFNNPKWVRYNELVGKYLCYHEKEEK